MKITEILGNENNRTDLDGKHKETVYVENEHLAKRLHHLTSDHGTKVDILLPKGNHLHVGDILWEEEDNYTVVNVLKEDVIVIEPATIHEMGQIAHNLGNRHLPAQFVGDKMVVQYDYLIADLLDNEKVHYHRDSMKMDVPFRYADHTHI